MSTINLDWISEIESSGNPNAVNKKSGATGQFQIQAALPDWNQLHKNQQYTKKDLFNPEINKSIANWYFHERIPQMLNAYGVPITKNTVLASYNWGARYVRDWHRNTKQDMGMLPKETADYIRKYNARELAASIAPIAVEPAPTKGKV